MPNSYPRDGTFNPNFTTIEDSFLICFPMNYRDFSVKINVENNSEIMIFIFTVEISARPLTSRDRTADVTYCAYLTFFQRVDVRPTSTFCAIFDCRFLAF